MQNGKKRKKVIKQNDLHIYYQIFPENKKAISFDIAFSPLKDKPEFQIHLRWVPGSDYPY